MSVMHDLKRWCSAKPELQSLHALIDRCDTLNSEALIDNLYRDESRKVNASNLFSLIERCFCSAAMLVRREQASCYILLRSILGHVQDLLCVLFQCLHIKCKESESSDTACSLRLAAVQKGLQHLSGSNPSDADAITALLQDNVIGLRADEAHDTIQQILQVFNSEAMCCLQLLPGLLNSLADADYAQMKGTSMICNFFSFVPEEIFNLVTSNGTFVCRSSLIRQWSRQCY
jgi:hypothetical protein